MPDITEAIAKRGFANMAKVMKENNGCWLLSVSNPKTHRGYRNVEVCGGRYRAHVVSYVAHKGLIPKGLVLDHTCRVRNCVNPDHLEAVTNRENILRGTGFSARNARKTHCIRGHELAGDNLYLKENGHRHCRQCQRMHEHKRRPLKGTGPGRKKIAMDVAMMIELKGKGMNKKQIAETMGLACTTVWSRMNEMGI